MLKFSKKKEVKSDFLDPSQLQTFNESEKPFEIGICFRLKYIGSHLLEELSCGNNYANGVSTETIKTILKMRDKAGKKNSTTKVNFVIKSTGLTLMDYNSGAIILKSSIDRISFCTADGTYPKIFAYIARNSDNETMECHAFSCPSSKIAFDVSLAVNQAFYVAKEEMDHKQMLDKNSSSTQSANIQSTSKADIQSSQIISTKDTLDNFKKSDWVEFSD